MNIKYTFFSCWIAVIMIFCALPSMGQTQQGVVKTRGRMVNGKLVPGVGLSGATVQLGDRNVVSNGMKGMFSFPARGKSYLVKSVTKKGYQLVDQEACRNYKYSADTLYLAMETPEQQQADRLAAERKIRRNLQRQLQQKEDEIEAMKVSNAVKDSLLRILYQQQGDNEKIIADMAKRYAALDYDQLDEFYRQVNDFIENGELPRADSLLRSRGDVQQQVAAILQQGAAIKEHEEQLAQAKSVQQAEIEETARRCYAYFESFQQQHMPDSAVHYLELRAALDTTNVEWQNETGVYINNNIGNYPKALAYYQLALRQSLLQYGEENEWTATSYNNIGFVYSNQGNYPKALEYYFKALVIFEKVLGAEHPDVATSYNNVGAIYDKQCNYPKAQEYYLKALAIFEKVLGAEHPNVALSYNNIGAVYGNQGNYSKALEYYFKALAIREKVLGAEHPAVATSYNNIGSVYDSQGDYPKSLEYYYKSLAIFEKVLGTEHPNVATSYNNIGAVYGDQGNYSKAMEFFSKALDIFEKVLGSEHPNTKSVKEDIDYVEKQLIAINPEQMKCYIYTATVVDGDTPARQQQMEGEYFMLEFAVWNMESTASLYDVNNEMRGKPKTITVMKDGVISQYHFENIIGVRFDLKHVGQQEKERIMEKYHQWKKR